jgi:putative hemolysin
MHRNRSVNTHQFAMVPRADIVYLDIEDSMEHSLKTIGETDHARFPVVRGGLENVIGV